MNHRRLIGVFSISAVVCSLVVGCGVENIELANDGGGLDGRSFGGECSASEPECNNCVDDDGDGRIDGFDPECTGAADDDEATFSSGLPGDNQDAVRQDCFFDGNSGGGNDGCDLHVCCVLDECPESLAGSFNAGSDCEVGPDCQENCLPLTPPGCDCFGCCTICSGGNCVDVMTNPATAPNCTSDVLLDEALCPRCTKTAACQSVCDPQNCILCPGQTEADLGAQCAGNECPDGLETCSNSQQCGEDRFCASGCCIDVIL